MPSGQRDWANIKSQGSIVSIGDIGELAARLGSIVTYDRRGNVEWYDDFEFGINKWYLYKVGTGSDVQWSRDTAKTGGYSCKLIGGSDGGRSAAITRQMGLLKNNRIGLESSFTLSSQTDYATVSLTYFHDNAYYTTSIKIDVTNKKIYYYNNSGNYILIDTYIPFTTNIFSFLQCKLVLDFETNYLIRFIIDYKEYQLNVPLFVGVSMATPSEISFGVQNVSVSTFNSIIYVDNVILTINEP